MARYTVERFSIAEPNGLRSRHETLAEARSSFDAAVRWYRNMSAAHPVAWCNLVSRDTMHRERYLDHWEQKTKGKN